MIHSGGRVVDAVDGGEVNLEERVAKIKGNVENTLRWACERVEGAVNISSSSSSEEERAPRSAHPVMYPAAPPTFTPASVLSSTKSVASLEGFSFMASSTARSRWTRSLPLSGTRSPCCSSFTLSSESPMVLVLVL